MEKIYPYAVAKIKVKENHLLTKANLETLASEKNIETIVSVLKDKGYDFDIVERYEEYGIVLKKAEEQMYDLIKEIIDEKDIIELFITQNDYHNIKLILKSRIESKEYKEDLIDSGAIPKEELADIMEKEEYNRLDNKAKNAIEEAMTLYTKTKMPFMIDAILDKACFAKMEELANNLNNEFIKKYIEKWIDITNIKTFFRVRKIYKKLDMFKIAYIEGGKISLNTYMQSWNEDEQNLKNKFIGFSDIIDQVIRNYESLDIFCDNNMMKYVKEAKLKSLTIEPIMAFIYAKKTEFKNIRIIFTGKLNNIETKKIKERLRESYV